MKKISLLLTFCMLFAAVFCFNASAYEATEGVKVSRIPAANSVVVTGYNGTESKVILPSDATGIANYAFMHDTVAISIFVPRSVQSIQGMTFYDSAVQFLYMETTTPLNGYNCNIHWEENAREEGITIIYGATIEDMLNGTGAGGSVDNGLDYDAALTEFENAAIYAYSLNPDDYTEDSWYWVEYYLNYDPSGKPPAEIQNATANLQAAIDNLNPVIIEDVSVGDINCNGKIDARDYLLLKRAYFGTYELTCGITVADINGNGKIDARDYLLLKRAYFGTYSLTA